MRLRQIICTATAACLVALAGTVAAQQAPEPEQFVDDLNHLFGQHPGARAVHAKGIVLEGSFMAAGGARAISKAIHLQGGPVPVTVRFSDFAGIPAIADQHAMAAPYGMAIKFHLPGGLATDLVAHSHNGFPSPTGRDFHELLAAMYGSDPKGPKPSPLDSYLAAHPVARAFLTQPHRVPASYATLTYFGVNAFEFTPEKGKAVFGRYQLRAAAGQQFLGEAEAAGKDPNFLREELRTRIAGEAIRYKLVLQLAAPGDRLDDPSTVWPENRQVVELGTLVLTRLAADNDAAQARLLFLPVALPDGINAADPMIDVRSDVYPESFRRRNRH